MTNVLTYSYSNLLLPMTSSFYFHLQVPWGEDPLKGLQNFQIWIMIRLCCPSMHIRKSPQQKDNINDGNWKWIQVNFST